MLNRGIYGGDQPMQANDMEEWEDMQRRKQSYEGWSLFVDGRRIVHDANIIDVLNSAFQVIRSLQEDYTHIHRDLKDKSVNIETGDK